MRARLVLLPIAVLIVGAVSFQQAVEMPTPTGVLLVAPEGMQPERDGVVGLDAAAARLATDATITDVVLLPGIHRPRATFRLANTGRSLILHAQRAGTAIIDGEGRIDTAMLLSGQRITLTGLTVRNYRMNGVVIGGGSAMAIIGNRFENIASHGWSQGAIHGSEVAHDIVVRGNTIRDVGYAGILFEASDKGRLQNVRIEANTIARTCRNVADCGAIYAQGRATGFDGLVIVGNQVIDFGPKGSDARGIYLDDGMSNAVVRQNRIGGTGGFALQIHGGSGNRITGNTVDLCSAEGLMFYQDLGQIMRGNVLSGNTLRARGKRVDALVKRELNRSVLLTMNRNSLVGCPT